MWEYLKNHEAFVRDAYRRSRDDAERERLLRYHEKQIAYMQHERLIHLIVTLFVALFVLLSVGFVSVTPSGYGAALLALLLVLLGAYIVHYFRLENGVQRWYRLANRIESRPGALLPNREGGAEAEPAGGDGAGDGAPV